MFVYYHPSVSRQLSHSMNQLRPVKHKTGNVQRPLSLTFVALWCVGRDVSEDIRASAIGAIGNWIRLMPSMFLVDNYLKYLAWALSDKACGCLPSDAAPLPLVGISGAGLTAVRPA